MIQSTSFVKTSNNSFYINTDSITTIQKKSPGRNDKSQLYTVAYKTMDDRGEPKILRAEIDESTFKKLNVVA